jgi:acid phosphatase family membrane protein YuiD
MYNWLVAGQLFIIPLAALVITQLLKVVIDIYKKPNNGLKAEYFINYGGMPSSHSALFVSLAIITLLHFGWTSFEFVVSFILYITVLRDAVGIRWHLGEHGKILKQLIKEEYKEHHATIQHDHIVTRLGHTPKEATAGTILGIIITVILYWWLN